MPSGVKCMCKSMTNKDMERYFWEDVNGSIKLLKSENIYYALVKFYQDNVELNSVPVMIDMLCDDHEDYPLNFVNLKYRMFHIVVVLSYLDMIEASELFI